MKIDEVIRAKGTTVFTIRPDATVQELVDKMKEHGIGSLVVSTDGETIDGIVGERDVLHHLTSELMASPVSSIMAVDVHTCAPSDSVEHLAQLMTEHRVRHVPVVVDGKMVALVSIGDVVKHRIDQLTDERDHLVGYVHQER